MFDNQNVKWMFNDWLQIKTLFLIYSAVQKFGVGKILFYFIKEINTVQFSKDALN